MEIFPAASRRLIAVIFQVVVRRPLMTHGFTVLVRATPNRFQTLERSTSEPTSFPSVDENSKLFPIPQHYIDCILFGILRYGPLY